MAQSGNRSDISVLLVDDDELVCSCISTWLEDDGFVVHTAAGGKEALGILARIPVDVALVDLQLQDLSGEELIAAAIPLHSRTRFMIHTGKHFYRLPAKLLQLGMQQQDVVFKPIIKLDTFAAQLRQLASGYPKNDSI